MEFVDKEDDTPLRLLDLLKDRFQSFLEFTTILRPGDKRTHIEREDSFILQTLRHVTSNDPLRKPLNDGGFTDTRLSDENRVVLGFP
jgi:hypothetical protein